MIETFIAIFAAHVAADYVFQTHQMVARKSEPVFFALHITVVAVMAIIFTGQYTWPIFLIVGLHLIIDLIKQILKNDSFIVHISDQAAHILSVCIISALAPTLWATGHWANAPVWVPYVLLLVSGFIFATRSGGLAVGKLMNRFDSLDFSKDSLDGAGNIIGLLERGLIFVLMIAGLPIGIGFLIAAKSVLRFEGPTDSAPPENRRRSEYIIIGTLASFSWAIAVSFAVILLMAALNGQPILEIITPNP